MWWYYRWLMVWLIYIRKELFIGISNYIILWLAKMGRLKLLILGWRRGLNIGKLLLRIFMWGNKRKRRRFLVPVLELGCLVHLNRPVRKSMIIEPIFIVLVLLFAWCSVGILLRISRGICLKKFGREVWRILICVLVWRSWCLGCWGRRIRGPVWVSCRSVWRNRWRY